MIAPFQCTGHGHLPASEVFMKNCQTAVCTILLDAESLLACRIENVVIEYSPGIYDKHFRWHDTPDWPKMLILYACNAVLICFEGLTCCLLTCAELLLYAGFNYACRAAARAWPQMLKQRACCCMQHAGLAASISPQFQVCQAGLMTSAKYQVSKCGLAVMACSLVEHGYTIYHLTDGFVRPAPPANLKWREFVPPALEEITAENLKHDLDDARQLQERTLGCFKPQDLRYAPCHSVGNQASTGSDSFCCARLER